MDHEPKRLLSARYLAMPLAMFVVIMGVTLIAHWQFVAILAGADKTRFGDLRGQVIKSIIDQANFTIPVLDELRYQADRGAPFSLTNTEWQKRVPFAFDCGYIKRSKSGGKDAYVVQFLEARDPQNPAIHVGDDLATDPSRAPGIVQAKEITVPTATPLFDAYGRQCIMYVSPTYRDVTRPKTKEEGNDTLLGFSFITIDPAMVYSIASEHFPEDLECRLLAASEPDIREPRRRTIGVGTNGYMWKIFTQPKEKFFLAPQNRLPNIQLVAGLVLAVIIAAWQFRQRIVLDRIIAERTSDLTKTNQRLEVALAREQEVSEMKSNFISTVSHEFRTPLGVILSSNGILKNYLDRLPEDKRAEHFHAIGKSVSRMTEMVEDVLLFSRAEANRLDFNPRSMNPGAFSHLIVDEVQSATERKCAIEISVSDIPEAVMADEKLLRPILRNLLENAVKYSPSESTVNLSLKALQDRLTFQITDQGIGIPKSDLARLGEAFVRAGNAQDFKGTGLGLAIVQRCVQRHNGTMTIESTEGQGTTVRVLLPLVTPPLDS